jgi:cyanophycinase
MPSTSPGHTRGYVIPIGGAEDKIGDRTIHRRFVSLAGGEDARITVIPTASRLPDTGDRYRSLFRDLGVRHVEILDIANRTEADDASVQRIMDGSTGIFMTGGNQLRLSTLLGGTEVARQIRACHSQGCHVAGTSAGAAFSSEHMIAFGEEGPRPVAGKVTLAPGLGLTNRVIVDQHFRQRNRLGRLLTALAYNPFLTGIGLDEDTAAFINADRVIEVVGTGVLTVVDVSDLQYSSMAQADEGDTVELIGVKLHMLRDGARYELDTHTAHSGGR